VLGDLFFDFDKSFTMLAEKAGLLPFNFEHDPSVCPELL